MSLEVTKSGRVKACTECRQQKLRCDASSKNYREPCSRCCRLNVACVVKKSFQPVKRLKKADLQAELEILRQQVQVDRQSVNNEPDDSHEANTRGSNAPPAVSTPCTSSVRSTSANAISPEMQSIHESSMSKPPPDVISQSLNLNESNASPSTRARHESTSPQTLYKFSVNAKQIDDCFAMFHQHYLPQSSVFETELRPNDCYTHAPLLFWTVVAIGSRNYAEDPTMIFQLAPRVLELAKAAIFARDSIIPTIQAFILLCAWPMPYNSLGNDLTPVLSGAMLQLALTMGLHVCGVGQDFSRIKLRTDHAQVDFRRRLWALCQTVLHRVQNTSGTPPIMIPDTYNHDRHRHSSLTTLPSSVRFHELMSRIHAQGILDMERNALSKHPEGRARILHPMIQEISAELSQLESECPGEIDRFYLLASRLQILSFHLFVPRNDMNDTELVNLYALACATIEKAMQLNQTQQFAKFAPVFVSKFLHLAAFLILRLGRSHLSESGALDLVQGQKYYFDVIHFHKDMTIRSDDTAARSSIILTQLWTSTTRFRWGNGGGADTSLILRCRSRLAMSVVFDCYWWWRQEFAGLPDPYEGKEIEGMCKLAIP
ncbi:hypothetical protein F5884DRAFT_348357 [Xylogone sp. PMI_703]|nr:hypothetical protein F5884DRAFT_348357 [Xylogone sp. PMI_703]